MDWRTWVFEWLDDPSVTDLLPGGIYSTLEETPAIKPFMVVRLGEGIPNVGDFQDLTLWVHDIPDGYTNVDAILAATRARLEGAIVGEDGITVDFQGYSGDLADNERGTVLRTSNYRLVGRRAS